MGKNPVAPEPTERDPHPDDPLPVSAAEFAELSPQDQNALAAAATGNPIAHRQGDEFDGRTVDNGLPPEPDLGPVLTPSTDPVAGNVPAAVPTVEPAAVAELVEPVPELTVEQQTAANELRDEVQAEVPPEPGV